MLFAGCINWTGLHDQVCADAGICGGGADGSIAGNDSGVEDSGAPDSGVTDAGAEDGGAVDSGVGDGGSQNLRDGGGLAGSFYGVVFGGSGFTNFQLGTIDVDPVQNSTYVPFSFKGTHLAVGDGGVNSDGGFAALRVVSLSETGAPSFGYELHEANDYQPVGIVAAAQPAIAANFVGDGGYKPAFCVAPTVAAAVGKGAALLFPGNPTIPGFVFSAPNAEIGALARVGSSVAVAGAYSGAPLTVACDPNSTTFTGSVGNTSDNLFYVVYGDPMAGPSFYAELSAPAATSSLAGAIDVSAATSSDAGAIFASVYNGPGAAITPHTGASAGTYLNLAGTKSGALVVFRVIGGTIVWLHDFAALMTSRGPAIAVSGNHVLIAAPFVGSATVDDAGVLAANGAGIVFVELDATDGSRVALSSWSAPPSVFAVPVAAAPAKDGGYWVGGLSFQTFTDGGASPPQALLLRMNAGLGGVQSLASGGGVISSLVAADDGSLRIGGGVTSPLEIDGDGGSPLTLIPTAPICGFAASLPQ